MINMDNFNNREKAFEKKFANDQEAEFKISAKRNKLLATWAANILNFNEEQKKNYIISSKFNFSSSLLFESSRLNRLMKLGK